MLSILHDLAPALLNFRQVMSISISVIRADEFTEKPTFFGFECFICGACDSRDRYSGRLEKLRG